MAEAPQTLTAELEYKKPEPKVFKEGDMIVYTHSISKVRQIGKVVDVKPTYCRVKLEGGSGPIDIFSNRLEHLDIAQEQETELAKADDPAAYEFVQAPKHYNDHPSGVECQEIIRECKDPMVAFAMKHLWQSQWGAKPGQSGDQDIQKAIEYLQLEQARRAGVKRL